MLMLESIPSPQEMQTILQFWQNKRADEAADHVPPRATFSANLHRRTLVFVRALASIPLYRKQHTTVGN